MGAGEVFQVKVCDTICPRGGRWDVDERFWSVRFIKPGVIGDKSNSISMSGIGITDCC